MASIQKRGKKWIAEVRSKGQYRSRLFPSQAEAKSWAFEEERKIGKLVGIVAGKTLGQAMEKYAEEATPSKKGARWERIRLDKLRRDEIADVQLTSLRAVDIEAWIERQARAGLKGSSINRELHVISAVLARARKRWKWIDGNPMADVERPSNPAPRDKTFSDDQVSRILFALGYEGAVTTNNHRIAVAFLIALETAMRQGEIFGLTWEHVHLEKRYVHLPDTKNGMPRDVPLSSRAVKLFELLDRNIPKVFPLRQATAEVLFRRAVKRAGIEDRTWHDSRHTATTSLAAKLDMLTLARVTGHKDPRMLLRYFNPSAHDIAKKLD